MRFAVRMTRAVVGLGPTQTSNRSDVAQGREIALARRADSTSV
jgi:hypothetical protein